MSKRFELRAVDGPFGPVQTAFMGDVKIGTIYWNAARSRDDTSDDTRYCVSFALPQLRQTATAPTVEEGFGKIVAAATAWVKKAKLNFEDEK